MNAPLHIRPREELEQGFELGELRVDPLTGEVTGPGGLEELDPKVMDVLVLLAQHADQVVLREHILSELWPHTVVTDDALSRCIYELRRQLSQAGGDERYKAMLETLPKRGYRLNGTVAMPKTHPTASPAARRGQRWLAFAMLVPISVLLLYAISHHVSTPGTTPRVAAVRPAPTQPATNSIAILPFADLSPGQDQRYFADGVAEEIINRLAQSRNLRVIARTSSFAFRDRPLGVPGIAARLNVSHVIEGSFRRSGDQVRITVQLIAAATNAHVWSQTYERRTGELFALQDEIAASVATALRATLAGSPGRELAPASAAAYERYLHGVFFFNRRAPGDIDLAEKYFREALRIDPDYASAWAALSGVYSERVFTDPTHASIWLARQGEAARKAAAMDPKLAAAHERLARYYMYTGNRLQAEIHYRKLRELDPDASPVLRSAEDTWQGDFLNAVAQQRQTVARDPLSAIARKNLGLLLFAAGQLEPAKSEFYRVLELNPDTGWDTEIEIGRILIVQHRYEEAYAFITRLSDADARDHVRALLYRAPGREAEAVDALTRLSARPPSAENVRLGEVYAYRGMTDRAFASLRDQVAAIRGDTNSALPAAPRIMYLQVEMRVSPFLKPLHDDPRWATLLADPYAG